MLSHHPARAVPERPAPFVQVWGFLPLLVDPTWTGPPTPFARLPLQQLHRYYEVVRPWPKHQYFLPCVSTLEHFPFASSIRFPSSLRKPRWESRPLYTGRRLASRQVSTRLIPESLGDPRFDVV